MRYIKNNGKPSKIVINEQLKQGYVNKKGERKEIQVVMYRQPNNEAVENKEAVAMTLREDQKAFIRYKLENDYTVPGGIRRVLEVEERHPIGFSQTIINFPHILGFRQGTSHKDERIYQILVGEIARFENEADAEACLKAFHFVDEVNEKGEPVQENPYKPAPSQKASLTKKMPTSFEEVDTKLAPRESSIEKRVTEITKAVKDDEKII